MRSWQRMIWARRRALIVFLAVAGGLVCLGSCAADRIVLGSNHEVIDSAGLVKKEVTVDGKRVECWVALSPRARKSGAEAVVLFFPGQRARAESWTGVVADAWGDLPVEVWGVNYPGYGGSDGPGKMADVARVGTKVYDEVAGHETGGKKRRIFVHAASFGTVVALAVAARRDIAGMVLQNPPPLKQLILGHYGWWNLWLGAGPVAAQVPEELDSLKNAREVKNGARAVFLVGSEDGIVPPEYQRRVVAAYVGEKRVVENWGGHGDGLTAEAAGKAKEGRGWLWAGR